MFSKIAVAYDESPQAERALRVAIELAKNLAAEVLILTVVENPSAYTAYAAGADPSLPRILHQDRELFYEELQAKAIGSAPSEGPVVARHLIEGDEVEAIAGFVREHRVDLLVVGLHHRSSYISRIWSTVYSLAQDVPCSILGVH